MKRDAATEAQITAARPDQSTWLAANAGSGKTRVLTDRVARLLLDGVLPEHILCLTYTKAAATEMQNRLFKRLGDWAMLSEQALRAELDKLGVEKALGPDFLRDARTLFARAIETPGGLRIQTIHSFCASLLRRFPLEARVSPQFKEMEDRAAERLRAEILDRMADGDQAHLIRGIVPYLSDESLPALVAEVARFRDGFADITPAQIRAAYGLAEDAGPHTALEQVFLGSETALCAALASILKDGGSTDKALGLGMAQVTAHDAAGLDALEGALLTQAGTLRKTLGTKKLRGDHPDLFAQLDQLAARVEAARETRIALGAVARDEALHDFAQAFLPAYEHEKTLRGWLDFDDLITRARDLLSDPKVADWVLYRLDGGIDHILVDEAQDTSPVQWQVIERLAHEFTSGEGARQDVRRTIFVVGDKKQSIYSFQGADPSEFDRMRDDFAERLTRTETPLAALTLKYSFRSAEPILSLVDATFEGAVESGFSPDQTHMAFKDRMPGRVDLWPLVEKVEEDEDGEWFQPVDRVSSTHHTVILARRIARFIKARIDEGHPLPVEVGHSGAYEARPVHAGDFLILVRSRGRLFQEIIRAAKQEGLPIAGSDRLRVMSELAVRDIIALLTFLATPEDDLSLATALRSPLFGMSEAQLYSLARSRFVSREGKVQKRYLWEELRDHRKGDFPEPLRILHDLMGQTDFLRPYDLIERILTRHKGRRLLMGRLGPEAEDGINALLGQALSYEQSDIPSLTGFLEWAQTDNLEIKRAPDSAGETLRVMTVHGSKGLEAPIVILPDTTPPRGPSRTVLMRDDTGVIWKQPGSAQPARQTASVEAEKAREAQERDRLLYVAMTRAEKWLIVAAAGDLGKSGDAWYDKVRSGMERMGAQPHMYDFGALDRGEGLALGQLDWTDLTLKRPDVVRKKAHDIPLHLLHPAPDPVQPDKTRSPSDLGGAKALPGAEGDTEEIATLRGTALHMLLEHLAAMPVDRRAEAGDLLVAHLHADAGFAPVFDLLSAMRDEALALVNAPALAHVFAAETLAEIPITADLPGIGRIHGVIDRLIVTPDRVTAVDFKSNRVEPARVDEVPEGLLRQMGAYAAALRQVYPDRQIDTALVWTRSATYMPLSHDDVTQALGRAAAS